MSPALKPLAKDPRALAAPGVARPSTSTCCWSSDGSRHFSCTGGRRFGWRGKSGGGRRLDWFDLLRRSVGQPCFLPPSASHHRPCLSCIGQGVRFLTRVKIPLRGVRPGGASTLGAQCTSTGMATNPLSLFPFSKRPPFYRRTWHSPCRHPAWAILLQLAMSSGGWTRGVLGLWPGDRHNLPGLAEYRLDRLSFPVTRNLRPRAACKPAGATAPAPLRSPGAQSLIVLPPGPRGITP